MRSLLCRRWFWLLLAAAAVGLGIWLLRTAPEPPMRPLARGPVDEWPAYGRDPGGMRYSPLAQIDRGNVARLEVAWTYHTGDYDDGSEGGQKTTFQATPLVLWGTMYFSSAYGRVIALDPETGAERWTFDPRVPRDVGTSDLASRGVAAWRDPQRRAGAACARRIFLATVDARLFALDAANGRPCSDFAGGGAVQLSQGIRLRDSGRFRNYGVTSPPVVLDGVVVVGSAIGDNRAVELERGTVRGYDARTGALRWAWEPVPRDPADPAHAQWPGDAAERTGAANAWAPLSADPERGLVFLATGSASPDYYGGERPGPNAYANSVVALRAATGQRVWHFQAVRHDLWDYDLPAQPVLLTLNRDGEEIPALAQTTKMGHLFLLNRETGRPLHPVEARPVPGSDVPGEQAAATQPVPTLPPPLITRTLSPDDAFGVMIWDEMWCRERLSTLDYAGPFTPPSLRGAIHFPGAAGGSNWNGLAVHPQRHWAVLNLSHLPYEITLHPRETLAAVRESPLPFTEIASQEGTPYGLTRRPMLSPIGLPCIEPPWGTLVAVDLDSGTVQWEVPFGTVADVAPIPYPFRWLEWGTPGLGGPIVTAGGLVFIGAAMDDYLRAFDIETGQELWRGRLPAGGQATPMTYRVREDGRQYVVIAAGGHGKMGTTIGDALVAFALPVR